MSARGPGRLVAAAASLASVLATSLFATALPAAAVDCAEAGERYIDESSYALSRFGIGRAWQMTLGAGVTVAVVDSGVAADNAHLREAVEPGRSFVPGDADPTGRTDIWGHGTAVASLIAGRPVKGSSVYGVAPSAEILPVRVFAVEASNGYVPPAELAPDVRRIAEGITWAATHGADVINVSMSSRSDDPVLRAAVREAVRRDVVVVASGGNREKDDEPDGPRYPAALPGVIGVAASDESDEVTTSSIHGPHIDVYAPGQNVPAAYKLGGDCLLGIDQPYSSYAAGYVSGVAALLRAQYPDETASEIEYRLTASADRPRRDQRDDERGWGLVQPVEALSLTLDPGRPGPPLPGAKQVRPATAGTALPPLRRLSDPLAPMREQMLWWLLLGAGSVALAFVLRPWLGAGLRRRLGRAVSPGHAEE